MADSGQHASNAPAMVEGSGAAAAEPRSTVGFVGLFALVVSAMVGGGIFSLPQNMAQHASAGGQIVAWAITGVGMWFIVNTFRVLTNTGDDACQSVPHLHFHVLGGTQMNDGDPSVR